MADTKQFAKLAMFWALLVLRAVEDLNLFFNRQRRVQALDVCDLAPRPLVHFFLHIPRSVKYPLT